MRVKINSIIAMAVLFSLATMSLVLAVSQPEGPGTFTQVTSTRRAAAANASIAAYAGNVTHLNVAGSTVTQTWQGYVGNVSGTITLDDSSGNTLYDWTLADPEGEIYATYTPYVDWTTGFVTCWNWSDQSAGDSNALTLGELEGWDTTNAPTNVATLGLATDDVDGVNETFSVPGASAHSSFYVAGKYIDGTAGVSCPLAKLYNSTSTTGTAASAPFEQVLLQYNGTASINSGGVIYTSILKDDIVGYDGTTWDFEMIVGEDGHSGNTATTTYYFYVELE